MSTDSKGSEKQGLTEALFAERLNAVKREARENGGAISGERVRELMGDLALDEKQLEEVFSYLKSSHIGVDEEPDADEYLTDGEKNYIGDYIEGLSGLPERTDREIERLSRAAAGGDEEAQRSLAESMLRDVPDIARLYVEQGVSIEDLIGEGNLALFSGASLLGALEGSDAAEIKQTLMRSVMDAMEALIAENLQEDARGQRAVNRVNEVADRAKELYEDLRREVTVDELMAETGWERSKIEEAWRLSGGAIEELDGSAFGKGSDSVENSG